MKSIIRDIFAILTPGEKKRFYLLTACNMVVSLLDIASLAGILFIIQFYTQPSHINTRFLPAWLSGERNISLILVFLLLFLLKNIAAQFAFARQYRFVYGVATRLSKTNMQYYLEGDYDSHVHIDSAVYIRTISQQPIEFAQYILTGLQQVITEVVLVLLTTITILYYNALLFLLVAALLLPVGLILWLYTRRNIQAYRKNIKTSSEEALQYLKEALAGYVESNMYHKNNFFTLRYANSQQRLNKQLAGLQVIQGLPSRLLEVFAILGLFILIIAANVWGTQGFNSILLLGAFMAAAYKIIPGLVRIINLSGQLRAYRFVIDGFLANPSQPVRQQETSSQTTINSIDIKEVSFNYNEHVVLKNFCLQLSRNDFAVISAASGRGKTTAIHILLGLIKEQSGEVCINGLLCDMNERKRYRERIAYVKQQNFLIHDTIEKNITLDDHVDNRQRLTSILQATGLDAIIARYPEGLQKILMENGKNISGGQRQRIAIARALYKDADLLVLDEPFSELDENAEIRLLEHFKKLANSGKMIILITHGQKALGFCNKIIQLHD